MAENQLTSKGAETVTEDPSLSDVCAALRQYGKHHDWCDLRSQMPMENGRTYTWPTDWEQWLKTRRCNCGLERHLRELPA